MGPYKSLCVLKNSNGLLRVFVGPNASLWIPMGPYRSSCVLKVSIVSLWILNGLY